MPSLQQWENFETIDQYNQYSIFSLKFFLLNILSEQQESIIDTLL